MGIAKRLNLRGIAPTLLLIVTVSASSYARELSFSSTVPADQVAQVKQDLSTDLTLVDGADVRAVMGIDSLSDSSLRQWLSDRVGYIIGESETEKNRLLGGQKVEYQNPGVFPDFEQPAEKATPTPTNQKVSVVMANVGTSYYYIGKSKGILVGYKFSSANGSDTLPIISPRVGIIKIGAGLFGIVPFKEVKESIVNRWFRLETLFHEAHHSDGNGKSLGFPHAVCPAGTVYAGYNACDRESNGAYGVGAMILKQSLLTCTKNNTCSVAEAAKLKALALDSRSRLLAQGVLDPKPESIVAGAGSGN